LIFEPGSVVRQAVSGQDLAEGVPHRLGRDDRVLESAVGDLLNHRAVLLALAAVVGRRGRVGQDGGEQVHDGLPWVSGSRGRTWNEQAETAIIAMALTSSQERPVWPTGLESDLVIRTRVRNW